ncbi:thioredoxin reductase [Haladaptatus sp. R4]|uniref:FAD-dependent oxidoreductase n=1 Tax=Haladaptatus sp. R4 TaxID=1679489 RepID=UPI0007B4F61F|nr:FAD-dependent oxidoreductase [Haladaptatus sp. R4]KZN22696.1 thioredoxin reductase [Haladaptatus sp. R4]
MVDVAVIGGGPAGLSAALFTQKNGLETMVFDTDETWMHKAHLFNYLGIRSIKGTEFMSIARGQVEDRGATIEQGEEVTSVEENGDGFTVTTDDGGYDAMYVVFATGNDHSLAESLGCELTDDDVVDVDVTMRTSVENAYATGAMVRTGEYEAVISAGDGGAAALNILSKEKGEHFHDFNVPGDVPTLGDDEASD